MNLKEIDGNGTLEGFLLVKSCDKKTAKNGSMFLDMWLMDKTGEINAKMWDYKEGGYLPENNTIVKVRGVMSSFNGTNQLRVDRIRAKWDNDVIDLSDVIPSADYEGSFMMAELMRRVEGFKDEELKKLVGAVLTEYKDKMLDCPGAFRLHHAIRGGLLMHTLSMVKLAESICNIYPSLDRELLLSGAMLHDVCKTEEYIISQSGLVDGYKTEGSLLGHQVMGAMVVDRIARELGISQKITMLIEHMLISHHGLPEYGAAVRPAFLEAEVLYYIDNIDAKIYEIEGCLADVEFEGFSNRQWALDDRRFYNHGRKVPETKAILD